MNSINAFAHGVFWRVCLVMLLVNVSCQALDESPSRHDRRPVKKHARVIKKQKRRCESCQRNPILVHDPYYVAYDPWPYSGSGPYWGGGWDYYGFRPYMGIGFSWGC